MSLSTDHGRTIIVGLGLAGLLFAAADFADKEPPHVAYEAWFNFYGFFAFVVTFGLVTAALVLKVPLRRGEDYYDG